MSGQRAKYWIFVINNPVVVAAEKGRGITCDTIPCGWRTKEAITYAIWQREIGESGTEHIQGYIAFVDQLRFNAVKELCPEAHWEVRKGTHTQAKQYSSKEDTREAGPWTIGDDAGIPDKKGQRMDLVNLKLTLDNHDVPMREVANQHFGAYLRYRSGIEAYRALSAPHREATEPPKIIIMWGPSGTGKSRKAAQAYPDAYWKTKSDWWQGYTGQKTIVFDEFYGWIKYDEILRILDWYKMEVHYKGASCPLRATTFVFTSNKPWEQWYPKITDIHALERRIREFGVVYHFTGERVEEGLLDAMQL